MRSKAPKNVLVYSMRGERLANTTDSKARTLIREKKARAYKMVPYSIQMLIPTGDTGKIVEEVAEAEE